MNKITISSDSPGAMLFALGNEAIARGAIEAGVQMVAAYPGTPSSEILETLVTVSEDHGAYLEWSVNEKVALEVAFAASLCGLRSMSCMKHVGVNVAHDPLMTAAYIGAKGGFLLVSADDPWAWSSQNEQDNRYIAEQAYIPVLEPFSVQEAKDMTAHSFKLSEEYRHIFMLRSVTRVGHARGNLTLGEISKEKRVGNFEKNRDWLVHTPVTARKNRRLLIERFQAIREAVDGLPYNQLNLVDGAEIGVIASGLSYGYAMEAINWLELHGKVSVLKVGTPWPLPEKLVRELLESVKTVLVVEELEPFVENHVKVIANTAGLPVIIHGKGLLPLMGELSTRRVVEALSHLSHKGDLKTFAAADVFVKEAAPLLPPRPPVLCPGCPHRASLYAVKVASEKVSGGKTPVVKPVYPSDIGCYTLGCTPPLESADTVICMGGSFGIANGMSHVLKAPVVAHLGDSTFFHSGIPPMINAVYNNAKVTMVILDNSATAMTGFQPHPGTGRTALGAPSKALRPEDIARACGVGFVEVVDPFDLDKTTETMERAIRFDGPAVIVMKRACMQVELGNRRRRGEVAASYFIDQQQCVQCGTCLDSFGCPAMIMQDGAVIIDESLCTGCGVCVSLCPQNAIGVRK